MWIYQHLTWWLPRSPSSSFYYIHDYRKRCSPSLWQRLFFPTGSFITIYIYIKITIYTHTYTCCYVSDLHGRTEQLINSKKLCWPYYIPFPLFLLLLFQQYSLKELSYFKILFFHSLLNLFQSSFCHFHFTKIPLFKIICVSHIAEFSCLLAVFILPYLSATLSQFITLSFETLFFSPAWQHITVVWFCSFNV